MHRSHRIGAALVGCILLAGCRVVASDVPTSGPSPATSTASPSAASTPSRTAVTASLPPSRAPRATVITLPGPSLVDAHIAAGRDGIWVEGQGRLYRIDPSTNEAAEIPVPVTAFDFVVAEGSAWITDFDMSRVVRIDLATGDQVAVIPVGVNPGNVVAAFGSIWTADHRGATVSRIDRGTHAVTTIANVGLVGRGGPQGIAASTDRIWVGAGNAAKVFAIDPASNSIVAEFPIGPLALPCGRILADVPMIWVSSCFERKTLTTIDPVNGITRIIGMPAFTGEPVRIGALVWIPIVGGDLDPVLLAFGAEDGIVADAVALPAGSEPDAVVSAFGSLWIPAPDSSILRISLTDLGG
jgi:streptogramin lyase